MERRIIFKAEGEDLTLPVTPAAFELESSRSVESVDMQTVGVVNMPGLPQLLDKPIDCMFPAKAYPFAAPDAKLDPYYYVEKFKAWSEAGTVLRLIISDTGINIPVLVQSIKYSEKDGTNDVYATIYLRGYRFLQAETVQITATPAQNTPRAETAAKTTEKTAATAAATKTATTKKATPAPAKQYTVTIKFLGTAKYYGVVTAKYAIGGAMQTKSLSKDGGFNVMAGTDVTFRWYSPNGHKTDYWTWQGGKRASALCTQTVHITGAGVFATHWVA